MTMNEQPTIAEVSPSSDLFDRVAFSAAVWSKMAALGKSYREVAPTIPVDHATLQRIASGSGTPNVETYLRLNRWLGSADQPDPALSLNPVGSANGVVVPREPVPMILHCPRCHVQHVDEPDERTPDWTNPPHRSHLCHACGCIWRPADIATEGVRSIATVGKADTALNPQAAVQREEVARIIDPEGWANWDDCPDRKAYEKNGSVQHHMGYQRWCLPSLAKADAIIALQLRGSEDPIQAEITELVTAYRDAKTRFRDLTVGRLFAALAGGAKL
jgi:hypothetical protein